MIARFVAALAVMAAAWAAMSTQRVYDKGRRT
jgi:hypothetical protein